MRAHELSAALHIAGMVCGVLLSGCAATAPSLRPPERDARPVRPAVWLLNVHEAPLLLLEAARFSPTDAVDVRPVGQTTQVTLRFQGAVRATPLITATGSGPPLTLRIAAAESSAPPAEHLVTSARAGRYAEVQRALDAAPLLDRDDLSLLVVNALSEGELAQMAHSPEGNLLVERLFDELTSGNVSEDEMRRAWLLLAVESQRRYPSPDDFGRALTHTRIFSYESMGFTNSGAPITASRRGDGRLEVHLTARSFRTGYSEDFLTLSGTDYVLEPDELVGVRLYDEGGVLLYVPALYLQLLSNKDAAHLALKMLEAGAMGLGLGAWALGEAGAEATATARALIWCDRAAYALGTASSLLLEHRGWIIQTFGDEGRTFLYSLEVFNSVLALYGVARVAMAAPRLVDGVRTFYKEFTTRAQRQRALGTLTEQQVATLDELQRDMGSAFEGLDAARDSRSTATANTSQASPPQAGGKVIPFDRARKPGPSPEANAQPVPSEGEETLAATGTDARLVPIRPQSASRASPTIASVKRPGQNSHPHGTVTPPPAASPPASSVARSSQPSRATNRTTQREPPGGATVLGKATSAAPSADEELTSLDALDEEAAGELPEASSLGTLADTDASAQAARADDAVARRAARMPAAEAHRYLAAVDSLRAATPQPLRVSLPTFLRASATAADPSALLRDAEWLLTQPGLSAEAAQTLATKLADARSALDLAWLRTTRLAIDDLDFLACDPKAPWDLLRRAAANPNDRSLQILARTRLRGIAGEMVTARSATKIFPAHHLTNRQVALPAGHIIDYELTATNGTGLRHAVEVKSWTRDVWRNALNTWQKAGSPMSAEDMRIAAAKLPDDEALLMRQLAGLVAQLKDAESTPHGIPFLVVTSGLSVPTSTNLTRFLTKVTPGAEVRLISEEEILATSRRLRTAFGLPMELPGVTP